MCSSSATHSGFPAVHGRRVLAGTARGYDPCMRFLIWLPLTLSAFAQTGEIRGTVVDARGGEALATTDAVGRFRIGGIAPGEYTLNVSTVGDRLEKKPCHLDAAEAKEFE